MSRGPTRRELMMSLAAGPVLALASARPGAAASVQEAADTATLIACGGPQILTLTLRFSGDAVSIVSRSDWEAAKSKGLPADRAPAFRTTDDCKPIDGGARVLVTSSSGGIAIIDRATGDTSFHAHVPAAHSAEVLPGNRIVVASSNADHRLVVFDRAKSGVELFSVPFASGHGVHWVESEQTLWALGLSELHAYALANWDTAQPSFRLRNAYRLAGNSGHDLSPVPNSSSFVVTTHEHVLTFDRTTHRFAGYKEIGTLLDVKSVSIHPLTGRVAFIQADAPEWWSRTIHFPGTGASLRFPNDELYKARWLA